MENLKKSYEFSIKTRLGSNVTDSWWNEMLTQDADQKKTLSNELPAILQLKENLKIDNFNPI